MNITPLSTYSLPSLPSITGNLGQDVQTGEENNVKSPNFFDVFSQIYGEVAETGQVKNEDAIRLMLGDVDNLEQIMLNLQKAEMAVDLLVNVRNTVLDSYNEIIKMQI